MRAYYSSKFSYEGKPYNFTGKAFGKISPVVSVKTAGMPLKIKSIKAKGTKVKSYKVREPIWSWYSNPWGGITIYISGYKMVKKYTTTTKVTVKLKKKPGAKGIVVGGKKLKGNKKVYKVKISYSGKLKNKKVKIGVYSYQDNTYKGYTKKVTKKVKLKK